MEYKSRSGKKSQGYSQRMRNQLVLQKENPLNDIFLHSPPGYLHFYGKLPGL